MTVEHDDIETVLGPLRDEHGRDRRLLWLSDIPDKAFTQSSEDPVCDWIGDGSHAELLDFAKLLKTDRESAFRNLRTAEEEIAAMKPVAFLAFPHSIPVLAPEYRWSLIQHQVAGTWVRQQPFCGLRLTMRPEIAKLAVAIHHRWYATDLGRPQTRLSTIVEYRDMLGSADLDCDESYEHLAEGFYPIDPEFLDRVAVDAPRFAELIVKPGDVEVAASRAIIAIVAPNSD